MGFYRSIIRGVVQGVGFRPYIYRKAVSMGLKGHVRNLGGCVEIVVNKKGFAKCLRNLPPLARISSFSEEEAAGSSYSSFSICASKAEEGLAGIPPDISICKDCMKELYAQKSRRRLYYFITCTNCGPRFTITERLPYDRPFTSMKEFRMCSACRREYSDPDDRRYHAQTIACPECGPRLNISHTGMSKKPSGGIGAIRCASAILSGGGIIAVKGVGGYHLCGLAEREPVEKIRKLLGRPDKPFAIMAKDIAMAERIAALSPEEKKALEGIERPVVALRKKKKGLGFVSELDSIGIMLPYTALHHMLLDLVKKPVVMTSFNYPGEPTITETGNRKTPVPELSHERRITNRCDDSVVKLIGRRTFFLRRSRGFTPLPVALPHQCADTIALGAELSNTVCVASGKKCIISQHIGDTSNEKAFRFMTEALERLVGLAGIRPRVIACDMHPGYRTSEYAVFLAKKHRAKLVRVQHHHSHIAGAAAEHSLDKCAGIAMDGLGYGADGELWGGEILLYDRGNFIRVGRLERHPMPGGDSAAVFPRKMLFGILSKSMAPKDIADSGICSRQEAGVYSAMIREGFNAPLTSSTGRVLDACAALLGLCSERTYEGRPAMLLESAATVPYELKPEMAEENGMKVLLTYPLLRYMLDRIPKKKACSKGLAGSALAGRLAATALRYIAEGLRMVAARAAIKTPLVFSGGVAYNSQISSFLMRKGCLPNKSIPCGDGGLCYGQAFLANLDRYRQTAKILNWARD